MAESDSEASKLIPWYRLTWQVRLGDYHEAGLEVQRHCRLDRGRYKKLRMDDTDSFTKRLRPYLRGDSADVEALVREIMPELRRIAARQLRMERYAPPVTLTELVNEFFVKYLKQGGIQLKDHSHFFILVSRMMRQTLVDMARKRRAAIRNGGEAPQPLEGSGAAYEAAVQDSSRIVEIGIAMEHLQREDPAAACIVDMYYFTGFTVEEIAKETGLTVKQVERLWKRGKRFLAGKLR